MYYDNGYLYFLSEGDYLTLGCDSYGYSCLHQIEANTFIRNTSSTDLVNFNDITDFSVGKNYVYFVDYMTKKYYYFTKNDIYNYNYYDLSSTFNALKYVHTFRNINDDGIVVYSGKDISNYPSLKVDFELNSSYKFQQIINDPSFVPTHLIIYKKSTNEIYGFLYNGMYYSYRYNINNNDIVLNVLSFTSYDQIFTIKQNYEENKFYIGIKNTSGCYVKILENNTEIAQVLVSNDITNCTINYLQYFKTQQLDLSSFN